MCNILVKPMEYCRTSPLFTQKGKMLTPRIAIILVVGMMYEIISNKSGSFISCYLKK